MHERSGSKCELCNATDNLAIFEVPPDSKANIDDSVLFCETCIEQLNNAVEVDVNIGVALMTVCGIKHLSFRY